MTGGRTLLFHMPTPGERWRAAREAAGMSAGQAAELAGRGYSAGHAYNLEGDKEGVTLRAMKAFAEVYGVSLGEIFGADDGRPERVPAELRPLLEPLAPLSHSARESIVRNIAANLRFMQILYGEEGSKTRPPVTTSVQGEKAWRNEEKAERATWRGQPRQQQKRGKQKRNPTKDRTEMGGDLGLPDAEKKGRS